MGGGGGGGKDLRLMPWHAVSGDVFSVQAMFFFLLQPATVKKKIWLGYHAMAKSTANDGNSTGIDKALHLTKLIRVGSDREGVPHKSFARRTQYFRPRTLENEHDVGPCERDEVVVESGLGGISPRGELDVSRLWFRFALQFNCSCVSSKMKFSFCIIQ